MHKLSMVIIKLYYDVEAQHVIKRVYNYTGNKKKIFWK